MEETKENRLYIQLGTIRNLDVRIILDGENVYEGMIEGAPDNLKELAYSKVEVKDKFVYYVYSELNKK